MLVGAPGPPMAGRITWLSRSARWRDTYRDDARASGALRVREPVVRAAHVERVRRVEIFALEEDARTEALRETTRVHEWRYPVQDEQC